MTLLDLSIVNVALPSLRTGLGADDSDLQWIVAGYALAFGVLLVPAGRLGDARSRRTVFVAGVALFTAVQRRRGRRARPDTAGGRAGAAGPRRRADQLRRSPGSSRTCSAGPSGPGLRPVRRHHRRLHRDRTAARRSAGRSGRARPRLAAGVLRQRADRGPADTAGPAAAAAQRIGRANVSRSTRSAWCCSPPPWCSCCCRWSRASRMQSLADRPWWLLGIAAVLLAGFYGWERFWTADGRETLVDLSLTKVRSYVFGLSPRRVLLRRLHLDLPGDHALPAGRAGLQRAGGRRDPDPVRGRLGGGRARRRPLDQPARSGGWSSRAGAGHHRAVGHRPAGAADRRPRRASSWPRRSWSPASAAAW